MKKRRNILLALRTYYPQIHVGVARYARSAGWHLQLQNAMIGLGLAKWDGDGVITQELESKGDESGNDVIEKLYQPKVQIQIDIDTHGYEIGKMAARHFLDLGFRNFACYAAVLPDWAPRVQGYWDQIPETSDFSQRAIILPEGDTSWVARKRAIQQQLIDAPKPLAVYAVEDVFGGEVMEAALDAGLSVPEDIAVLGVDNNELICETLAVPLTSIDNNLELLGYQSASLLDRMFDGKKRPNKKILVKPRGVVVRRSSNILAVSHPNVARAMRFIWDHFTEQISIEDVAQASGMSLRALYYAFQHHMRRTIGEELENMRMHKAEQLLFNTDLKISAVAVESGFSNPLNLYRSFNKKHGISPSAWRKSTRQ